MKTCKVCETEVENDIRICPVCGSTFDEKDIIAEDEGNGRIADKKRNIVPIIIAATVLLLALIIGFTCYFVFSSKNKIMSDEKTSVNLSEASQQIPEETTATQSTTVEIILNEKYYIKHDKNKEYVPMYKESDIESEVIKKFVPTGSKSVEVTVIKEKGSFYYVEYNNKSGYISKDNLTKLKQKSTSVATATSTTAQQTTVYNNYTEQQTNAKATTRATKLMLVVE